jgi:ABC-type methionine transport system permease subunit
MWVIRELLANIDILWQFKASSFILNYRNFILLISHLGLPIGSVLGILLADKLIFKLRSYNLVRVIVSFLSSVFGIVLVVWILPILRINVYTFFGSLSSSMGYDLNIILLPLISSLFAVIAYNVFFLKCTLSSDQKATNVNVKGKGIE